MKIAPNASSLVVRQHAMTVADAEMPMASPSFDIWEEAELARSIGSGIGSVCFQAEDDICSDEEDEWGNNLLESEAREACASMIRLPDGDIHLCGPKCCHAVLQKDGDMVCPHSGMVVGFAATERTDYSTGRSTWSADPDMHGGAPVGGAWRKKIDRKAASKSAYLVSSQFDDTVMPAAKEVVKSDKPTVKRGALCVDEEPDPSAVKRARNSKKECGSVEQMHTLVTEASGIFTKLMSIKPVVDRSNKKVFDRRLINSELLFNAALRKYCKEMIASGARPSMDDVHNISLAVEAVVIEEKRKLEDSATMRAGKFGSVRFRNLVARLAVSLWLGACKTPYMDQARRGGDSFRPFCVGVYYSLKRGLTLGDGTVLVPACRGFEDALPTQRDVADNQLAKSLHASSHRGLCSIHRCIASVGTKEQHEIFLSALRLSVEFSGGKFL